MHFVPAHPVAGTERINSLDVLRGFALLGILVMNIQMFAMVGAAYIAADGALDAGTRAGEPSGCSLLTSSFKTAGGRWKSGCRRPCKASLTGTSKCSKTIWSERSKVSSVPPPSTNSTIVSMPSSPTPPA